MTTYSFEGYGIQFPEDDGPTISVSPETLEFVILDGSTSFSYNVIDDSEPDAFPDIGTDLQITNVVLDGVRYTSDMLAELQLYLGQVVWSGGTTYILSISASDDPADFEHIFRIAGVEPPAFSSPSAVDAWLNTVTFIGTAGGAFAPDQQIAVAALTGATVSENDSILGTTGEDALDGGAGDDTINPLSNDSSEDMIRPGGGNDRIIYSDVSSASFNILDYSNIGQGITANLNAFANTGQITGAGTDTIVDFAAAASADGIMVIGTASGDTFNVRADVDDYIQINPGGGNDTVNVTVAVDSIVRVSYSWGGDFDPTQGVVVDLSTNTVSNDGFGGTDTITVNGNGWLEIEGSFLADSLTGSDRNERFITRNGADTVDGAGGWDVIRYDRSQIDSVVVDLEAGTGTGRWNGNLFTDTLINIEEVRGSRNGDDMLTGDGNDNRLRGNGGDDTLRGGEGNDRLQGDDGDDVLMADGSGSDTVDGGNGTDLASYEMSEGRVLVDLQNDVSGAAFARFFTEGAASGDIYFGIENILGGAAADNLRGDAGANEIDGGGVSDRVYGRGGNDTLNGGAGADAIYGNLGADVMTGGDDAGRRDRFIYFQAEESGVGAGNRDIITDFVAGEDRIELGRIDADITQGFKQAFDFVGEDGLDGTAGQLGYRFEGGNTIVEADRDGDGVADFEIELTGTVVLTADDFLI